MADYKDNDQEEYGEAHRPVGAASVIVAGIFVVCMVFIGGKVLFSSNSAEVPAGIDTATINTNVTVPKPAETAAAVTTAPTGSQPDAGGVVSGASSDMSGADSNSSNADSSKTDEAMGTKYITEYAYLHTQPSNESENIICMTPGIAVNVLSYEENGYVKVTFDYLDGPMTGYIYQDYLSDYQTVVPDWEQQY